MANKLTIDEAIAHFGVSRSTLMRWIKSGKVNSCRQGRRRFILVEPEADRQPPRVAPHETEAVREASPGHSERIDASLSIWERNEETVLVVLRDRVEQIERERDLAIRRIGQLEEASAHLSFWRRGMLAMMAACLLATVVGAAAWTWAWNELAKSQTEVRVTGMERDRVGAELKEVKSVLVKTSDSLESERAVFAEDRSRLRTKLDISEAALGEERAEHMRLAQDLATAVSEAAARDLSASDLAKAQQVEIGRLRLQLANAQMNSAELGLDEDETPEPKQANASETEMYGPPNPQGMRASNDE